LNLYNSLAYKEITGITEVNTVIKYTLKYNNRVHIIQSIIYCVLIYSNDTHININFKRFNNILRMQLI